MKKATIVYFLLIFGILFYLTKYFSLSNKLHSFSWTLDNSYSFVFEDSIVNLVDFDLGHSFIGKYDICNKYIYNDNVGVLVWVFDHYNFSLSDIKVDITSRLDTNEFDCGEIWNTHSRSEIECRCNLDISKKPVLLLNLMKDLKIKKINGITFYTGNASFISISDSKRAQQINIRFDKLKGNMLIYFYVLNGKLYLFVLASDKSFDDNLIDIFKFIKTGIR